MDPVRVYVRIRPESCEQPAVLAVDKQVVRLCGDKRGEDRDFVVDGVFNGNATQEQVCAL